MSSERKRLIPFLTAAALIGLSLWFFVSGCGKDEEAPIRSNNKRPPLEYESWEKPAAVLVFSGEQRGYIEPCGCSETQSGGLARRASLIHDLMKRGWPLAGLDLGGALRVAKDEAGEIGRSKQLLNKLQSRLKFNTMLKVLGELRYSAVAIGYEELLFGEDDLIAHYQSRLNTEGNSIHPILMAANLLIYDGQQAVNRTQTVKIGDVNVGVTAIIGEKHRGPLLVGDDALQFTEIKPPAEVLPGMIKTLNEQKTDFNVLLSHTDFRETEKILKQFPDFAVALCQSGSEEGREEPRTVGNTLVLEVGRKGKHVGVLAYYPDTEQKFRYELVELNNEQFENDPSVEPHLLAYQGMLKICSNPENENQDTVEPRSPRNYLYSSENMASGFHPKAGNFVGAAKCGECHTKAYAKWKDSKHAHAYDSLKTGREGQYSQPIPRTHDPECLACHVTGWSPQAVFPYDSGFVPEVVAKYNGEPDRYLKLQGNQCENCHGPGSRHSDLEWQEKKNAGSVDEEELRVLRRQMVLSKAAAEEHLCTKCHDYENSPKFRFDEYWKKIEHPWRD